MAVISESLLKKLYEKRRMSSAQIARYLKCSQNKVNYWIKKYNVNKRTISEAIYLKRNPSGDPFKIKKINSIYDAGLLGLGLGIFWGEGNKRNNHSVRVGNSDPLLIIKFIQFLVHILGVRKDKLRFGLQIFNDISEAKAVSYWLKNLEDFEIKKNQFFKVTVTKSNSIGTYREKSKYGVMTVHFSNTKLKKIIDNMIAEVAQGQSNSMVK